MIFYEIQLKRPRDFTDLSSLQPRSFSGHQKNFIFFTSQDQDYLTFCQVCSGHEISRSFLRKYLRTHNLQSCERTVREIFVGEFVEKLKSAQHDHLLKSYMDILKQLHLESFLKHDKAILEMRCETGDDLSSDISPYTVLALQYIRADSDHLPLMLFPAETVEDAPDALENIIKTLNFLEQLKTGRICILRPFLENFSSIDLGWIYKIQQGGTILVDLTSKDLFLNKSSAMDSFMSDIDSLAYYHQNTTITGFLVHPDLQDCVIEMAKKLNLMSAAWIPSIPSEDDFTEPSESCEPEPPEEETLSRPDKSAMEQLEDLIGLEEVKQIIKQAVDYSKAQQLYREHGFPVQHLGMHMVFSGNPGTAKTTVARLVAQIFKENHILSKGKLIEVGRSDLIGKYVGWTAKQVKRFFLEAQGSVLFIDEAYSLVDDRPNGFGDEAINMIVQEMENHRQDTVVIFAGYKQPMEKFLERNAGLRSRITFHVSFPDYQVPELMEILQLQLRNYRRELHSESLDYVQNLIIRAAEQENFGNGRYIRVLIEKALFAQASRLMALPPESITDQDILLLQKSDFRECKPPQEQEQAPKRIIGFAC